MNISNDASAQKRITDEGGDGNIPSESNSARHASFLLCRYSAASHKVNRDWNPPEDLLKHRLLDPTPEFDLFGLEWSLIICFPNKFSSGITGPARLP